MKSRMHGKYEGWTRDAPLVSRRDFTDHPSRDGKGTFFAEPYDLSLDVEAINIIRGLILQGWHIRITGTSKWNRGECFLIEFSRKE